MSSVASNEPGTDGAFDLDPEGVGLSWQPSAGATQYDVHFGTTDPPPYWLPNLNITSISAGTLEPNTTYYWRVYAKNNCGYVSEGPVMFFTTGGFQAPEINVTVEGGNLEDGGSYTFEEDDFVIIGEVQKPEITVYISRENLNKSYQLELKESFLPKIVESVEKPPF